MTNKEKHTQIKKCMRKQMGTSKTKSCGEKGCAIFDLLLEWGALTKVEAASILMTQTGAHSFLYAWDYL